MDDIIDQLMALVVEISFGEAVPDPARTGSGSIRELGLNSLRTLNFLVAVEDTFGIEWDDDLPEEVLDGFTAMARYIADQRGAHV
ncbi:acyl carrier protein [Micromonospora sp. WMMD1082]|uniref:acyl carrier protein n=1 Tax=Micromonospora sp. WMMD1082 TaxID=3016104 RepID=UPI002416FCCB|nr:acyl carrier protein [Micromonospora sp. WMMD1082]MDG4794547.1 acyl carrier protein [Micromonospora sp. WMMD1082]